MTRVLVTGASGAFGSAVTRRRCATRGAEVAGLDLRATRTPA